MLSGQKTADTTWIYAQIKKKCPQKNNINLLT